MIGGTDCLWQQSGGRRHTPAFDSARKSKDKLPFVVVSDVRRRHVLFKLREKRQGERAQKVRLREIHRPSRHSVEPAWDRVPQREEVRQKAVRNA